LVVVEFGSGSGNLLLPLAVRFPEMRFIAVDDRPVALKLLLERAARLGMRGNSSSSSNSSGGGGGLDGRSSLNGRGGDLLDGEVGGCRVEAWAGRIESYAGPSFDVAISLHACGAASDHAIEASLTAGAPYLVSPCCVGKVNLNFEGGGATVRSSSSSSSKPSPTQPPPPSPPPPPPPADDALARPRSRWLRDQLGDAGSSSSSSSSSVYREMAARADRSETAATAPKKKKKKQKKKAANGAREEEGESEDEDGEEGDAAGLLLSRRCKALVELDRNQRAAEAGGYETYVHSPASIHEMNLFMTDALHDCSEPSRPNFLFLVHHTSIVIFIRLPTAAHF
jgi:hypothetical protein